MHSIIKTILYFLQCGWWCSRDNKYNEEETHLIDREEEFDKIMDKASLINWSYEYKSNDTQSVKKPYLRLLDNKLEENVSLSEPKDHVISESIKLNRAKPLPSNTNALSRKHKTRSRDSSTDDESSLSDHCQANENDPPPNYSHPSISENKRLATNCDSEENVTANSSLWKQLQQINSTSDIRPPLPVMY